MMSLKGLRGSETFKVHNGGTRLIVLLLGDPHLLEGGQRGQDGATDPHAKLALRGRYHFDLRVGRGIFADFFEHSVGNSAEHHATSGYDDILVHFPPYTILALGDRVIRTLGHTTASCHAQNRRLEQCLGASEQLVTAKDHIAIGKLVALLLKLVDLRLLLKVQGHVA